MGTTHSSNMFTVREATEMFGFRAKIEARMPGERKAARSSTSTSTSTNFLGSLKEGGKGLCFVKLGRGTVSRMVDMLCLANTAAKRPLIGYQGLPRMLAREHSRMRDRGEVDGLVTEFLPFSLVSSVLHDRELRAIAARLVETLSFYHGALGYAHTRLTASCIMLRRKGADAVLVGFGHSVVCEPSCPRHQEHKQNDLQTLGSILVDHVTKGKGKGKHTKGQPHWVHTFLRVAQDLPIDYKRLGTVCSNGLHDDRTPASVVVGPGASDLDNNASSREQ